MRARTAAAPAPFSMSRAARSGSRDSIYSSALAGASCCWSHKATSWPARAKLIAQARPIKPAPTTATLPIASPCPFFPLLADLRQCVPADLGHDIEFGIHDFGDLVLHRGAQKRG